MSVSGWPGPVYEWHDETLRDLAEGGSVLEALAKDGIVSFERTDRGIRVVEQCDLYHGATLTIEQFRQLIRELADMVD